MVTWTGWPGEESYNVFRWYRGGWGRYSQSDPIGLEGGLNLYRYSYADPIGLIDPLGLKVCKCERRLDFKIGPVIIFVPTVGALQHEFIQIVPDGSPCGGFGGKAWGYQNEGDGKGGVQPEATPEVWPLLKCKAVPCIDEKKLNEKIAKDLNDPSGAYSVCNIPWKAGPWNQDNCQGWVDKVLSDSKKEPCCP
jgi:RHS repeat-associated protein